MKTSLAGQNAMSRIRVFLITTCIIALTPRVSADITLFFRLSDARAVAMNQASQDDPPPQIQTDFLKANLSNQAMVAGESGFATAHCGLTSSILVDNSMGTLRVTGNGNTFTQAEIVNPICLAQTSAKIVVLSFTLTDFSYSYSMSGQLSGMSSGGSWSATAKLIADSAIIFQADAPPEITLSETGILPPGNYSISVELVSSSTGGFPPIGNTSNSSADFTFALGPTPTPTPCPACTPTPTPTPPGCAFQNFDSVVPPALPSGWVASNPIPGDGVTWVTSADSPDSSPNDAFIPDQWGVSDKVLDTPSILISSFPATVTFRNYFNMEFQEGVYWDGGVLEVSSPNINGGAFIDVTHPAVGGSFVTGGYTGDLTIGTKNPLAGRRAWSGDSGGYITTIVDLGPHVTGQVIKLRFRMGSDEAVAAPGWRIDNLFLDVGPCGPPTPTHFEVIAPPDVVRDVPFQFSVRALDQFNNTATNYTGTVHFLVGGTGVPPPDSTLSNGGGYFTMRFFAAGIEVSITATDTVNPSITGTSNGIFVHDGPPPTPTPTGTPSPPPTPSATPTPATSLLNISTRLLVLTDDHVGIGGFIITGNGPRQILLRGIGPSLGNAGVLNPLIDPVLELHGPNGFTTVINNNWRDTQGMEIMATGIAPTNELESAILMTLDPAAYTAILKGIGGGGVGVGLVEIYDLGQANSAKVGNISTRGFVGTGSNVLISGFILGGGSSNTTIFARGLGPSLCSNGLQCLPDPRLECRNSEGVVIASITNCLNPPPPFPSSQMEPCIETSLSPGAYTALLSGVNNNTGVGLLEVYNLGALAR